MRYTEILNEGRDAPLYHWMDDEKVYKVLKNDALKPLFKHKLIKQMGMGISMTRNKNYKHDWAGNTICRLTFNQARLAHDHRIIPVDAHHIRLTPKQFARDYDPSMTDRNSPYTKNDNSQMAEEYVLGEVKPLHKYVTEIYFYYGGNERLEVNLPILLWSRKFNIPLILDGEIKDWGIWVKDLDDVLSNYDKEDTYHSYLAQVIKSLGLRKYLN